MSLTEFRIRSRFRPPEWLAGRLALVLSAAATWSFGFSTFFLLPRFMTVDLGVGPAEVGWVSGIFGFSTVLFTPICGWVVDRRGPRTAILAGALMTGASALLFLTVTSYGPWLIALRILQAFAHALAFIAVNAAAAALAPPERLSQALGFAGVSMLVMNALTPALVEPIALAAGWATVFWLAAGASALSVALTLRLHPDTGRALAEVGAPKGPSALDLLRRPLARAYVPVAFGAGTAFGTVFAFEQPLAISLGRELVGGFFLAFAVTAFASRTLFGWVPDHFGRHRVATASLFGYAVSVTSLAFVPGWGLELVGLVFGASHGFFFPSLNAIALSTVSPAERGRLLAIFTAAFNVGLSATAGLGVLADSCGYPPVFLLTGTLTGAAALLLSRSNSLGARGPDAETPLPPKRWASFSLAPRRSGAARDSVISSSQ